MYHEFFVVALSLALVCFIVFLTLITQLQVYTETASHDQPWTAQLLASLGSRLSRGRIANPSDKNVGSESGRPPGKRARRAERRRQRHALSSGGLSNNTAPYRSFDRVKGQKWMITNTATSSTHNPPCSGCKIVSSKRDCSYNCCARCCRTQTRSVCRAHGTGYTAAVESVEGAVQYKYHEFDISYGHLKVCPPRVTSIGKQLVSLNLSNNRLSSLPEDLGVLSSLRELFLQYNNLTLLPISVCDLRHLVELDVKNNRLRNLPESIGRLRHLVVLNITNNCVSQLPSSIGRLTKLEELGVHSNQLTELPEELCNLKSLKVLYGGENRFKSLPSRFGQLLQLQELDVSSCELESLPESLSHCISLVRLWLSNNRLHSLPVHIGNLQQLKELHLRNNQLQYLPASVEQLHLYTLTAQNNSFIDDYTAQEKSCIPKDTVPPLLELAGRAVLKFDDHIMWDSVALPVCLREMLSHPKRCSMCEGPFFKYFSSLVTFKTVGVFYRVPLCLYLCSPHRSKHCKTL